jgi:hypothetical protein
MQGTYLVVQILIKLSLDTYFLFALLRSLESLLCTLSSVLLVETRQRLQALVPSLHLGRLRVLA